LSHFKSSKLVTDRTIFIFFFTTLDCEAFLQAMLHQIWL